MKLKRGKPLLAASVIATLFAVGAAVTVVTIPAVAGPLASVDVKQGAALQNRGAMLLDVREPDEYAQGHAPGSTLIPLGQLEQRLNELAGYKNKPVAVICHSGRRSAQAATLLEKAGFSAISNVEGGMVAWQKAGLPVVTGPASR
jgi:rhodanese-related sulfurtransferase